MDKKGLQTFATWSKQYLEQQIELSLKSLGIHSDDDIREAKRMGDVTIIDGDSTSYPAELYGKREQIIKLVKDAGYRNIIEEFAYTWFNRFVALRFMEVHGFLSHGFRILSNPSGGIEPEILKNLNFVKGELKLDLSACEEYKQQGKLEELFRYVLIKQCNVLAERLPMLFSVDMGYLELLLPQNLLKGETVITKLVEIPEDVFLDDVEIIGWMYQFYISSKKDAVYASKKTITKDTLPAVTQLFTPDWIVRYMAENSVGRIWMESYPDSSLRTDMRYYVDEAKQTEEVQKKLEEIRYKNVNPEDIKIIEPCCGSGHILVYVFDLLFKMYEEKGYLKRDIPTLILRNNLTGLDVDKRASQLASFALIMKARSMNNRFFDDEYYEKPHVYEIKDSQLLLKMDYRKQIHDLNLLSPEERELIYYIVETFENGKTIGSLLIVKPIDFEMLDNAIEKIRSKAVSTLFNVDFLERGVKRLKELSQLAKVLSYKYDVMITNPPYIGPSTMEAAVIDYATQYYPNSKADMFAMFMETGLVKKYGLVSMINMESWMSLPTYEKLRKDLFCSKYIINMLQLGARAFDTISGEVVKTTTFIMREYQLNHYKAIYYRLVDGTSETEKEEAFLNGEQCYLSDCSKYSLLPGYQIDYWISENFANNFANPPLRDFTDPRKGIVTMKDELFIRFWYEVCFNNIIFDARNIDDFTERGGIFAPIRGGKGFRKWYGNKYNVIYWENDGERIKSYVTEVSGDHYSRQLFNMDKFFLKSISWNSIASSRACFRDNEPGSVFGSSGPSMFPTENRMYILALLNSVVGFKYIKALNSSQNLGPTVVGNIPYIFSKNTIIEKAAEECINLCKADWDSFEISWNFKHHPFLLTSSIKEEASHSQWADDRLQKLSLLSWHYEHWKSECDYRFSQLKENEEEINRLFIDIYGLQDELTSDVADEDITVRKADLQRDIKSFISYLVGVVMGRYSLDAIGLVYAGGEWDASKYRTYQPDDDGIVPIYLGIGMEDGLTTRIAELVRLIYGEVSFKENIDFIAEALGKSNNESSMETINRYLNDGFYVDHLKIYQKRPIYWLFSSGKQKGFKCLIYMHRYNKDTLARINAKYYLPESTRQKIELEDIDERIKVAEGKDRIKLEKTRTKLFDRFNETIEYGQVLDHMANQYIDIDLDDGVKVNYAKFQEVELVSDSGVKIKKDLLVPLK